MTVSFPTTLEDVFLLTGYHIPTPCQILLPSGLPRPPASPFRNPPCRPILSAFWAPCLLPLALLALLSPQRDLILREPGACLSSFLFLSETETLLILESWPPHGLFLCRRNMWSGGGGKKKKRSGIGDFHNYASQAFATIQLTVFFLPCQVGLLWLVLMQHPPPNPASSPAF